MMPKFKAQARIESQRRTLGARSVSESRSRKSNAGVKLSAKLANAKAAAKAAGETPNASIQETNKFGSGGEKTTHSTILSVIECDSLVECAKVLQLGADACNNILNVQQLNMKEIKDKYASHKADVNRTFREQHGDTLSGELDAMRQNALAKGSTRYFRSQVIVEVTSEQEFDGAEFDEDRNLYVFLVRSKAVYTANSITNVGSLPKQGRTGTGETNVPIARGASWNEATQSFDRDFFRKTG